MFDKLNAILALFTEAKPEWPPAAAARELKLPRSTAYRILARMADAGLLDHDPDTGRYRLGIRLAALGALAQRSSTLQRTATPVLRALCQETQESVSLLVRSGPQMINVHIETCSNAMISVSAQLAERFPMHASASGKAYLAFIPDDTRAEVLNESLTAYTSATVTDVPTLLRQLEQVRAAGYVVAKGEWQEDIHSVSAPVRNYAGAVVAVVSVAGPRVRMTDARIDAIIPMVKAAASEISTALGHMPPRR